MKSIAVKIFLIIMFLTGFLQWKPLNLEWENYSIISISHLFISIVVSAFLIIPFVNSHTYKYIIVKKVNSGSGWILGVVLLLITISGIYLFLVGNRGGDIMGSISYFIHFYGSLLMIFLFVYHIKRKDNDFKTPVMLFIVFLIIFIPTTSKSDISKFTSIKLEDKVQRYHDEDWTNSTKCKSCHNDIFNQWVDSNHKNMTESNPYYMVLEAIAGEVEGEEFRSWCMGCHNPNGLTTGLTKTSHPMNDNFLVDTLFEKGGKTLIENFKKHGNSRIEEGVSCLTCHRISDVKSSGNASYSLNLKDQKKYPFEESKSVTGQWLSEKFINAKPEVHKNSYMKPIYKDAKYCASCHDETSPITGKDIVSTYKEWERSPYNNPKNPKENKSCIDCHMTYLQDNKFSPLSGKSTDGGKIKKDMKVHYFSGSNHFLSGLKSKEHEEQTIQLLKTSANLDLEIKDKKLYVGVKNVGAGHHLPTGVADFRELWLDVTVKDSEAKIVFSSGKLKENGDLSSDARVFMKVFGDKEGKPVGLEFWKYEKLISDTRIPAKQRRVEIYDLDKKADYKYPLEATIKLNFRIYPQWVTNQVRKSFPTLPNPTIVELKKIVKKFRDESL